jgi:hypothetical protein
MPKYPECHRFWLEAQVEPGVFTTDIPGGAGMASIEEAIAKVEDLRTVSPRWRCAFRLVNPAGELVQEIPAAAAPVGPAKVVATA